MASVNLKPSSKGVMALIIAAVVIFVGCVLEYVALSGKMGSASAELKAKQQKVTESKEIALKLEKSRLDYQDTLSQLRFLEAAVSTEAYVPTLLKQLEGLSKSVNLKVSSIEPAKKEDKPVKKPTPKLSNAADAPGVGDSTTTSVAKVEKTAPYDERNITVEFEGKYTNVLDFLYKVTSFPKVLAVKTVSIQPRDNMMSYKSAPILKVKMEFTSFLLKKEESASKPSSPTTPASNVSAASKGRTKNEAG